MKREAWLAVVCPMVLLAGIFSGAAHAAGDKTLSYGVGLRAGAGYTAYGSSTPGTTGQPNSVGITTLDVRPYISGQVLPFLKFEGNLDLNNSDLGRIHVLDAVAKFEPDELFNVWFGRFLPPSDRANLSGPYYQNAWNYPTGVNAYPAIYAGRDEGAAIWGQVGEGRFKYQVGTFSGGVLNSADKWRYAGRLTLNLFDPEPGYYNSSTYY